MHERTLSEPECRGRLLISCPERPGIVAAVSQFLFEWGAHIVHSDQHSTGVPEGRFFMRIEFALPDLAERSPELEQDFQRIADRFAMEWRLTQAGRRKRLAIFVSKEEHCLLELLWQRRMGGLDADIAMVISNHPDLQALTAAFDWYLPYHHVPVPRGGKAEAERRQLELLEGRVDTIILARYMQILSGDFVSHWPGQIINIHHSFLPSFAGARPHEQAYRRGVKLIGATAHYVTEELDAGPIIEQDVERVDHRHGPEELRRLGRLIERVVLARAVAWHVEDRILVHGNKTVVFS
ncbi:MAG TPA: formyltetrahydrofolate deformylase [Chloroflexota bacterium]|nr:formyltetrahydrofolate deformylase [Chloroflexota bacterium]